MLTLPGGSSQKIKQITARKILALVFSVPLLVVAYLILSPNIAAAATITVNSTADTTTDTGECTLREAILAANTDTSSGATGGECTAGSGTDTINFNISGTPDFTNGGQNGYTIAPTSSLPDITTQVTIDGYTQPGAQANTAVAPQPLNGILLIEVDGTSAGIANAFVFTNASDSSTIKGLIINSYADGDAIQLFADDISVQGNYIGTDPAGSSARPNVVGVNTNNAVPEVGQDALVGGLNPADRNLISGNTGGTTGTASYPGPGWVFQGNYIGVAVDGLTPIANSTDGGSGALSIDECSDVVVGGSQIGAINVFGESLGHGIAPMEATNLLVEGNYIGLGYDGETVLGNMTVNSSGSGFSISDTTNFTIKNNRVAGWKTGGISVNAGSSNGTIIGNTVFANSQQGISVIGSSDIQIGSSGNGNTVRQNNFGISLSSFTAIGLGSSDIRVQGNSIESSQNNVTGAAGMIVQGDITNVLIGGALIGQGNNIRSNTGPGIVIAQFSAISIGLVTTPLKVSMLGNAIYDNVNGSGLYSGNSLGIDLLELADTTEPFPDGTPDAVSNLGPTLNDGSDVDNGPNNYMNFPVLNAATQNGDKLAVNFDLDAADSPLSQYRVEFFVNDTADPSGYGEGQTYLGSTIVSSGADRTANLTLPSGTNLSGKVISATTTAIDNTTTSGYGATSEFSQVIDVTITAPNTTAVGAPNTGIEIYWLLRVK